MMQLDADAPRLSVVTPSKETQNPRPWEYPAPHVLYKFCRATPVHLRILVDCRIRFSQRQIFEDDPEEFQPLVLAVGGADEVLRFAESDSVLSRWPRTLAYKEAWRISSDPEHAATMAMQARRSMRTPNELAALCLTDDPDCNRMWDKYASKGHGFVIAFDTEHPGFRFLTRYGILGKAHYSDNPLSSLLSADAMAMFFRKKIKFQYESEWRILRHIRDLGQPISTLNGPCYLAPFDPTCVKEILIRKECAVENDLQRILASDSKYAHIQLRRVGN